MLENTVPSGPQILSIEQLNLSIKQMIEGQTGVIWVQGEISNFKPHTSGHFYFSLKDSKSQISAVMFRGYNSKLKFKPKDGLEVIARGRLSVYEPRGSYQILCEMMEPVGAGALQRAYEELKEKLKKEGLFESSRKKQIPQYPQHVAIVTSPTGAAIQDIMNILSRRAPSLQVTVIPTLVQGPEAAPQILEAYKKAQRIPDVDVIIVGRGGGSIEDLWAFNDEKLCREISASLIPTISAVGHEIDFTIADFVADLRAPTPSAAAELVAKSHHEIIERVSQFLRMMNMSWERLFKVRSHQLESFQKRLVDPQRKLQDLSLKNDDLLERMQRAIKNYFQQKNHQVQMMQQKLGDPQELLKAAQFNLQKNEMKLQSSFEKLISLKKFRWEKNVASLESLSPLKVVDRGYSLVSQGGKIVKSTSQLKLGQLIEVRLADGQIEAEVKKLS
jgi:exodeoxyribonuclease VII large subunit